jgi:hypothetical protein
MHVVTDCTFQRDASGMQGLRTTHDHAMRVEFFDEGRRHLTAQ